MDLKGKKDFKAYNVIVIPQSEDVKKGPRLTAQSIKYLFMIKLILIAVLFFKILLNIVVKIDDMLTVA